MKEVFDIFNRWYKEELNNSSEDIPSACCLSTVGEDGFPNSRFVSLKEICDEHFIICGPLNSRKGREILSSDKVALTFWWPATQKQIRIQGTVSLISEENASAYFKERSFSSQVVSHLCRQGEEISDYNSLEEEYSDACKKMEGKEMQKPENWGGFKISPLRIEFMEFKTSRLHYRVLFSREGEQWKKSILQP
ncbi:pyridoxamine 5'-phosphate oxidase [Leptobacterium flavescens]|uniref:Pyridoxamine 5'-phosphate oxidase n=1 Tax=Leptobacterium flavescens TaxID=472055 RepID=A0A6P0UTE6_9FLAO|nr:pyridoxal 5'-phosphate synthase [Leptobacterium flavescens]NER13686.1 pyridoxamine 5'-phosphate oxidase [Leptobacterium flavescens]